MSVARDSNPALRPEAESGARAAGFAYLLTIAAGLFAEVYVRASIRSAEPEATATALEQFEGLYRFGMLADGVMLIAYLVVTALLYRLFKPASASLSLLAACFSLTGIAVLAASLSLLLIPLNGEGVAATQDALRLHGRVYNLTGLFFGPYCILIGLLVVRSGLLPKWIGALMTLAGAAFVLDASLDLIAPDFARRIPDAVMLISLLGEGALALWLAVFGIREPGVRARPAARG